MSQFTNIEIGGLSLELWRAGSGKPLLFLHSGDGIESSMPLLETLAKTYDVIAPSHPGFGGSDLPDHFTTVDDLAYFYLDLIQKLGLENVVLVGVSFGAWIAAQIAVKDGNPFDRIVLVGPMGAKFQDAATREITDLFSVPQYEQSRMLYADGRKIDYSDWPEETLQRLARNHISFALFGWSPTLHDRKLRQRLARIATPALVISGGEDRVVSPDYCRRFAEALPNATYSTIAGAGHYAHVDAGTEFEAALDAFVAHGGRSA